jgi:hypothetical protein
MKRWTLAILACLGGLSTACGHASDGREVPSPKPNAVEGGEILIFPAEAALPQAEGLPPTARSVEMRIYNASPVGIIDEEARHDYHVYAEIENVGDQPLAIQPAWVRARVLSRGAPVEGCTGEPVSLDDDAALGTSGALFVSVPLPCALDRGRYRVEVELTLGAPPGSDDAVVHRRLRAPLVVDASLPPYHTGWVAPGK